MDVRQRDPCSVPSSPKSSIRPVTSMRNRIRNCKQTVRRLSRKSELSEQEELRLQRAVNFLEEISKGKDHSVAGCPRINSTEMSVATDQALDDDVCPVPSPLKPSVASVFSNCRQTMRTLSEKSKLMEQELLSFQRELNILEEASKGMDHVVADCPRSNATEMPAATDQALDDDFCSVPRPPKSSVPPVTSMRNRIRNYKRTIYRLSRKSELSEPEQLMLQRAINFLEEKSKGKDQPIADYPTVDDDSCSVPSPPKYSVASVNFNCRETIRTFSEKSELMEQEKLMFLEEASQGMDQPVADCWRINPTEMSAGTYQPFDDDSCSVPSPPRYSIPYDNSNCRQTMRRSTDDEFRFQRAFNFREEASQGMDRPSQTALRRDLTSFSNLDHAANVRPRGYKESSEKTRARRKPSKKQIPSWCGEDVLALKKTSRRLFNAAKASRSENDWITYKDSLRAYKKAVLKAKRASLRS